MRNCLEMTRLISEGQDRPLTKIEKMEISFHTMMCVGCKSFQKNSNILRELTQQHNTIQSQSTRPTDTLEKQAHLQDTTDDSST